MASPAYPDSDDGVGSEFEGSDDGTQTDITVSDSDQEYLPENVSSCMTVHLPRSAPPMDILQPNKKRMSRLYKVNNNIYFYFV